MRFNISFKLFAINALALAALVIVGVVAATGFRSLEGLGNDLYARSFVDMSASSDIAIAFQAQTAVVGSAPAELDLDRLMQMRERFDGLAAEMTGKIDGRLKDVNDAKSRAQMEAVSAALKDYAKAGGKVFDFASVFAQEDAINALRGPVAKARARVDELIEAAFMAARENAAANVAEMRATAQNRLSAIIAIVAVLFAFVGGAAFVLSRSITTPLNDMTASMGSLADGDLATDVPARDRNDEIGDMAAAVQVFKDNAIRVREMEREHAEAEQRAQEEKRAALNAMADAFDASVGGIVENVASASTEMQSTAESMSAISEETNSQAQTVASAAETASTNVQTVASSAEELSSSIGEISRQMHQSAEIANNAVHEVDRTNDQVQGLANAADKIGEVVAMIQEVADQTNLLALNATIEAARAGEAGKGFAVVASEVKNLANQTAKATEEIGDQISGIQNATRDSVRAIGHIGDVIGRINEITASVAAAVEQQGAATHEIARNAERAAGGTTEVSENIAGVTRASRETGSASHQVLQSANGLSVQAELLRAEVDKFIAEVRSE